MTDNCIDCFANETTFHLLYEEIRGLKEKIEKLEKEVFLKDNMILLLKKIKR